jgi:hypothetical protein
MSFFTIPTQPKPANMYQYINNYDEIPFVLYNNIWDCHYWLR